MVWEDILKNEKRRKNIREKRRKAFAQRQGYPNISDWRQAAVKEAFLRNKEKNKGRYMPEPPTRPTISKPKKEPKPKREIPKRNLIQNYFEMYQNKGKGKPTMDDIVREEGRPLTVDEIKEYNKLMRG
jgi:hypothetical protein|tara:strand:+ start:209 stop:592 length:384 start_codon:yes stop_codon:yes gene_type:complete